MRAPLAPPRRAADALAFPAIRSAASRLPGPAANAASGPRYRSESLPIGPVGPHNRAVRFALAESRPLEVVKLPHSTAIDGALCNRRCPTLENCRMKACFLALAWTACLIFGLQAAPARAADPTATGLWAQVEENGKIGGWFLIGERSGVYEGAIVKMFP